jgi:4'-phosphopantetheinyl transferase
VLPSPHPADPAGADLAGTVVVLLADRGATRAADHHLLVDAVARLTGADASSVRLSQRCPTCGKAGHGPLRVDVAGAASPVLHVSLARTAGRVALAVTAAGPVGVDLEFLAAVVRAPIHDALLSPAEAAAVAALPPAAAATALTTAWTAKEALLKAAGVGLRVDPRTLTIDLDAARPALVDWPAAPFPLDWVHLLPVPGAADADLVITVAVVSAARPQLLLTGPGPRVR